MVYTYFKKQPTTMTYTVDFQQAVRNFREAYEEKLRNHNHICNTIQPGIDFIEHRFVQLLSDMTSEFQAMRGRIVACDRHPEEGDAVRRAMKYYLKKWDIVALALGIYREFVLRKIQMQITTLAELRKTSRDKNPELTFDLGFDRDQLEDDIKRMQDFKIPDANRLGFLGRRNKLGEFVEDVRDLVDEMEVQACKYTAKMEHPALIKQFEKSRAIEAGAIKAEAIKPNAFALNLVEALQHPGPRMASAWEQILNGPIAISKAVEAAPGMAEKHGKLQREIAETLEHDRMMYG